MLFKVSLEDLEKLSQPILHRGLWFVQLSKNGWELHSVFLPRCLGTSLAFTFSDTVNSEYACHAGVGRQGYQMTGALYAALLN